MGYRYTLKMFLYKYIVASCSVLLVAEVNCSNVTFNESVLHATLFEGYNRDIMPRHNTSKPMQVTIDTFLLSIDNIDEKRQSLTVLALLEIVWKDEFLTWDPDLYAGVSVINMHNEDIWLPDIALQGTFISPTDIGLSEGKSNINHNGKVVAWPYKMYTVKCKITVAKFPFDRQHCEFDFVSWTNPTSVLMLNSSWGSISLRYLTESGEWELVNSEVIHDRRPFVTDSWDHVTLLLDLQRKSLFHLMNVMAPVLCISVLNITCFILPSEEGERVTLSISIFLTLAVFLTVINSSLPESSDEVAAFNIYVGLQLFGSGLAIIMTVISLFFFYRNNGKPIPLIYRTLTKLCCLQCDVDQSDQTVLYVSNGDVRQKTDDQNNTIVVRKNVVTWQMVSSAIDRLCLVAAICWHVALLLGFAISLSN